MTEPKLRFKDENGDSYPKWEKNIKLEEISEFITKGATPTTYGFEWQNEGIPFFRNDAIKDNVFVYGDYSYISEEANNALKRSEVQGGDLLIAITGDIGKIGMVPWEIKKANINQHTARIRITKNYNPYFVYQYLASDAVQKEYKKIKTGLSMPQLSLVQIRESKIPAVSQEEQDKIANLLSSTDEVISILTEEVRLWEEKKKGVMQKIFSQEVRFKDENGEDYPEWEAKELQEIGTFYGGLSGKGKDDFGHGLGKYITYMNVNRNTFIDHSILESVDVSNNEKQNTVAYGDIIFTQSSETVEECGITSVYLFEDLPFLNSFCMGFRPNNLSCTNPLFMGYLMRSSNIRKQIMRESQGISRINLAASRILNVKLTIPCLEEQQKIADCLSAIDEVIAIKKQKLETWKNIKKGLLQQMFV